MRNVRPKELTSKGPVRATVLQQVMQRILLTTCQEGTLGSVMNAAQICGYSGVKINHELTKQRIESVKDSDPIFVPEGDFVMKQLQSVADKKKVFEFFKEHNELCTIGNAPIAYRVIDWHDTNSDGVHTVTLVYQNSSKKTSRAYLIFKHGVATHFGVFRALLDTLPTDSWEVYYTRETNPRLRVSEEFFQAIRVRVR